MWHANHIFFPLNRFDGKPFLKIFKFWMSARFRFNSLTRETVVMMPLPSAQGNMQKEKKLPKGFLFFKK